MNKTLRRLVAPALFLSASFAPSAGAESLLDFTLENRTGYTLTEIYMSPARKDHWGRQLLKAPLRDGGDFKLAAPATARVQSYDLKAVYKDGSGAPVWYDLKPATFSRLTLKWDKAKNKTVAVKHK